MSYQICGHCNKLLSEKSIKEHQRLYFENGQWLSVNEDETASTASSSVNISLSSNDISPVSLDNSDHSDESVTSEGRIEFTDLSSEEFQEPQNEVEHWNEKDSDLDEDFPEDCRYSPDPILFDEISEETLSQDDQAIIWWVIAFTCVFQTLHSISGTAISWLLKFLGTLLSFLGLYSSNIARVASAFPCTLYQRKVYLQNKVMLPSVCNYVACPSCHNLYKFKHCLERRPHTQVVARVCFHCESAGIKVPLLKQVVTRSGSSKFYPFLAAPNACLISSLQCLLSRPGFYNLCESWRHNFVPNCSYISDVYYGKIWNDFMKFESISFLEVPNSIGLMLNIDWFQPFKHRQYSIMERQDRQKFWTKRSSLGV